MPKLSQRERFKISCEVEIVDLGETIATLTRMGFDNITFDMITDVRSFARNAPPKDGINSVEFLRKWTETNPTFKAIDAVKFFETDGRSKGAAYPAMSALVDEGFLKKLGPAQYSRADVKHIAPPKKKTETKIAKQATQHKFEINAEAALLSIGRRNHGKFTSELAKKHFSVQGRKPTGVGPCINKLMKDKLIRRTDTGSYELTAKAGIKKLTPARKPNGVAPPEPVEIATVAADA
jgi:hypothetical protein